MSINMGGIILVEVVTTRGLSSLSRLAFGRITGGKWDPNAWSMLRSTQRARWLIWNLAKDVYQASVGMIDSDTKMPSIGTHPWFHVGCSDDNLCLVAIASCSPRAANPFVRLIDVPSLFRSTTTTIWYPTSTQALYSSLKSPKNISRRYWSSFLAGKYCSCYV